MSKTYVINRSIGQREIPVVNDEDGARDSIFVQPNSKAVVPPGCSVDAEFLAVNSKEIEIKTV